MKRRSKAYALCVLVSVLVPVTSLASPDQKLKSSIVNQTGSAAENLTLISIDNVRRTVRGAWRPQPATRQKPADGLEPAPNASQSGWTWLPMAWAVGAVAMLGYRKKKSLA